METTLIKCLSFYAPLRFDASRVRVPQSHLKYCPILIKGKNDQTKKCQAVITIERLMSYTELDCKWFLRDECRGNRNRRRAGLTDARNSSGGCFSALFAGVWRPLAAAHGTHLPLVSLELWIKDCDPSEEASYVIMGSIVLFSDPRPDGSRRSSDDPVDAFTEDPDQTRIVQHGVINILYIILLYLQQTRHH